MLDGGYAGLCSGTSSQTTHPWSQEDLSSQMAGADYLSTCPHGPDLLTSASWLISSCWFNINPEGSGQALRVLGADTLWRTSEACGYLVAWPWLPCLALCTASMVRGAWKLGQAGGLGCRPVGCGPLARQRAQGRPPGGSRLTVSSLGKEPGAQGWTDSDYFSLAIRGLGWG